MLLLVCSYSWGQITGNASFCMNTAQSFVLSVDEGTGADAVTKTEWDFGDGSTAVTVNYVSGTTSYTEAHTYKKRGIYTITIKAFRGNGTEVTEKQQTLQVKVNSCRLPVNHNISTMGY